MSGEPRPAAIAIGSFSALACLVLRMDHPAGSAAGSSHEAVVAVIAFGVCIWVAAASSMEVVYWTFLLLMLGLPVYVAVARKKLRARSEQLIKAD